MPQYTRFDAIPQMTRTPSYKVDVAWADLKWQLETWTGRYGLEIEPDFQRAHVWETERSAKYVEYILRGGKSSRAIYWNCPGWGRSFKGPLQLVDGQQRLKAVLGFLNNEVPIFGGAYYRDFTDKLDSLTQTFEFYVNDLRTRTEVLNWYLDLNEGGIAHTESELSKVRQMLAAEKERKS